MNSSVKPSGRRKVARSSTTEQRAGPAVGGTVQDASDGDRAATPTRVRRRTGPPTDLVQLLNVPDSTVQRAAASRDSTPETRSPAPTDWRVVALLTIPWLVPGVIAAVQVYLIEASRPPGRSLVSALAWQLPAWMVWAAWSLLIRLIALTWTLDRLGAWRWAGLHAMLTAAVSFAQLFVAAELDRFFQPALATRSLGRMLQQELLLHLDLTVVLYWTVLGSIYMVEFHRRFRQRELDAAELRAQLAASQLEALRMQLNPHFLFNALNGVGELSHTQPDVARRMLTRVSALLRQALRTTGTPDVELWRELELADAYLDIARMRFGDAVRVDLDVEPAALDVRVPSLLLQPLLENVFEHGFAQRPTHPRLSIIARVESSHATRSSAPMLCIEIADNGTGMRAATAPGFGIGLSNVRARLHAMFPGDAFVDVSEPPGGGCAVRLRFPARVVRAG